MNMCGDFGPLSLTSFFSLWVFEKFVGGAILPFGHAHMRDHHSTLSCHRSHVRLKFGEFSCMAKGSFLRFFTGNNNNKNNNKHLHFGEFCARSMQYLVTCLLTCCYSSAGTLTNVHVE